MIKFKDKYMYDTFFFFLERIKGEQRRYKLANSDSLGCLLSRCLGERDSQDPVVERCLDLVIL
jgi:hypothetical protein